MSAKKTLPSFLQIGIIGKPHGIKGAFSIHTDTYPRDVIFDHTLLIGHDHQVLQVQSYESHHKKIICFSADITDRTAAQQLTNQPVFVKRDLFFKRQLINNI